MNLHYIFWNLMVTMSFINHFLDGYSLIDRDIIRQETYLTWSSPNIEWNGALTRKKYQLVFSTTINDNKVVYYNIL